MLKPDDTLLDGRYVIVRKIAKGGMGIVYLAHDTRLGREVAMKVLPPEVADDRRAIRDLKQEAETAAKLQHENIVAVYDFGQSDELYFITMEYVDGQTLSDLVYFNHPLPIAQVIDIMLQICAGLQYMHERQVLHRDIKPHNIMIKPGGTVKITDFGIAHLVKQTVTRHTGTTSGTVAYAAPELFTGQQSDARTDIYSLGVSLFEIVTNDLPFNGMDITYMHREVPAPSPMTRYPQLNIHPQIDAIVLKCMQKRPDDRFGSMVELRELLLTLQRQLGDRERLPDLLREAQTEQRAGNAQAAAQRFQYILGVDPGNVEAQQGLRQAQEQLDRQRAVAELFQQAQDAAAGGDYQRAIELSQQVLAIDPGNAAAQAGITAAEQARADRYARIQSLFREAQEAVEARNYQRAIELSQQVLAIDPGNAAAQAGVAAAQRSLREQQAEREALISQATAAHDSGNYRDAIQLWNRVLDTAPDHPRARAGLARSEQALQQQQQQEVERLLAQARDEQQAGNLDASVQLLERAVRIDRAHAAAQAALKAVRKALNTRSKELARLADQARRQEDDGDLKDAIATWQRVLQLDPAHQDARTSIKADQDILDAEQRRKDQELRKLVAQAQAEEQRKEYATAIQTWQRALQLTPDHKIARDGLERATRAQNQRDQELRMLVAQAQAEEQRKEYATAIQTWQRALQLAPDHKIARDGLKRAREQEEAQRRAQQQQLTRTSQQAVQQQDAPRKIDYAVAAAWHFIQYLHRDGFDRGMVATFGDDCRLAQGFTSRASQLQTALARVSQSVGGQTRLYDSMQDIVYYFYQHGDKRRPWLLTVITDGMDNASQDYRQRPDLIGAFLGQTFMSDRTNFMFLIGVGEGREIDASALATIGRMGGFPATTIAAFSLLEELFVQIALQVTEQLVGQQVRVGNLSWAEIARVRQVAHVPLDYAFLIDRSTSMNSAG